MNKLSVATVSVENCRNCMNNVWLYDILVTYDENDLFSNVSTDVLDN